jgi:pullulanase/glycogen debranching enzyme
MNKLHALFLAGLFAPLHLFSQIVWTEPVFPTPNQPVTVFFDATQGTAGLAGCSCDVYLHTGLITNQSTSGSDWKYVVTSWGVANAAWKMTPVAGQPDVYSYDITPTIKDYYGVTNPSEEILKLAFVFRNGDGSLYGKETGGADIFYDVYPDNTALTAILLSPAEQTVFATLGGTIQVSGASSQTATLSLFDNGDLLFSTNGTNLDFEIQVTTGGTHLVEFLADNGSEADSQSFTYLVPAGNVMEGLPAGVEHGINYTGDTSVVFALYAPGKQHVFLTGDFNDWQPHTDYQLKLTPDGTTWWIQIDGLTPGEYYAFQYIVDGTIRIGDPYSNIILDPANDGWIPASSFPDIPPYPTGKTTGIASVMQPGAPPFDWQATNYQRPEQENVVIYELLLRDFLHEQNFQALTGRLDYLQELGITAVELMPVSEFNGNLSWGYDPAYHHALDKFYGSPEAFKTLVDACHQRGIAVIMDIVFNHAHEKNPLAMLYWDDANFRPAPDNPWLNVSPTHDYNVFFDFNHDSPATKAYVIKTLRHWLNEYRVDGFRFDLSKGFTQNVNGAWDAWAYDASRIATLKTYAGAMWDASPGAYVILEHFTANTEEKELSDYGMMLWGNMNYEYLEASMGYSSNLTGVSYQARGWNDANLIGYMESHDEERMMYKNLQWGNGSGGYSVKNLSTALDRVELASTFFYTVPGPKMLWQFGELGYDFSINYCTNGTVNDYCRLDPKPVKWDYAAHPGRVDLYNVIRGLLALRNNYPVFQTTDFQLNVNQYGKTIHLNDPSMNVTISGNFDVGPLSLDPDFQHTGWWYEYFTGDSLMVSGVNTPMSLAPGEYRLYTDVNIGVPEYYTNTSEPASEPVLSVFPNPSDGHFTVELQLETAASIKAGLYDLRGQKVASLFRGELPAGQYSFANPAPLPAGMYFLRLHIKDEIKTVKIAIVK